MVEGLDGKIGVRRRRCNHFVLAGKGERGCFAVGRDRRVLVVGRDSRRAVGYSLKI